MCVSIAADIVPAVAAETGLPHFQEQSRVHMRPMVVSGSRCRPPEGHPCGVQSLDLSSKMLLAGRIAVNATACQHRRFARTLLYDADYQRGQRAARCAVRSQRDLQPAPE